MLKAMSKPQGVLKMFMLGMLKTILKKMLKYKKKHHHTLWHVLKLSGRFRFSPSVLHELLKLDIFLLLFFKGNGIFHVSQGWPAGLPSMPPPCQQEGAGRVLQFVRSGQSYLATQRGRHVHSEKFTFVKIT